MPPLRFQEQGNSQDQPRTGRPRVSTVSDDRALVRECLSNRKLTVAQLRYVWSDSGVSASKTQFEADCRMLSCMAMLPKRSPY